MKNVASIVAAPLLLLAVACGSDKKPAAVAQSVCVRLMLAPLRLSKARTPWRPNAPS